MKTKDFANVWKAALTPFAPNYAPALSLESTISEKPVFYQLQWKQMQQN